MTLDAQHDRLASQPATVSDPIPPTEPTTEPAAPAAEAPAGETTAPPTNAFEAFGSFSS